MIVVQIISKQNCNKLRMITSSKENFDASLTKTDKSVENMNQFMLQQETSPIFKFIPKQTRTFGVNTSRLMVFDNSIELILPITHLISSGVKNKNNSKRNTKVQQQGSDDGLDEQTSAPYRSTYKDPINNYCQKESKNHSYNKVYKSRQVKNWQMKGVKNPQKIEKQKPLRKESKLQQLINQNMRNMQKSQNIIMQSRKINDKFIQSKKIMEDRPIAKKNFKISSMNSKLSQSKLFKKEQIINEAKKMVPLINDQKFSRVGKIVKNQTEKKIFSTVKTQQMVSSLRIQKQFDQKSNEQNVGQLFISLTTPISKIKRSLIQTQNTLEVEFMVPQILFFTPTFETSNDELKQRMLRIFGQMGIQPQIVSIKKYQDRVELRNKSLFIIWGFDGSGYFGGWSGGGQILAESNRHGIGIEWSNTSIPIPYTYYGQFKDNKKEGYGVIKTSANQVYIGCWKNSLRWGWGKFFGPDNELKYNGEFIEDKISTPELLN